MIAAFVHALIALLQFAGGSTFGLKAYGEMSEKGIELLGTITYVGERGIRRIGGVIGHPNLMGAYLALVSGVGFSLLFTPIRWVSPSRVSRSARFELRRSITRPRLRVARASGLRQARRNTLATWADARPIRYSNDPRRRIRHIPAASFQAATSATPTESGGRAAGGRACAV